MLSRITVVYILLSLACVPLYAQDFVEDFEQGVTSANSYHKAPNELTIEEGTDNPAVGSRYARVVLPGERAHEGLVVSATGLPGARLANVTAQVRGEGELWLCLYSRNGWLYSPNTVTLTDQWQDVSLSKVLVAQDTTLSINFMSREAHEAVFEVDDIRMTLDPPLDVYDAAVSPLKLEAEDFTTRRNTVVNDAAASGGAVCRSELYVPLMGLPFPRTSRPVSIYARVNSANENDTFRVMTTQGGLRQTLQSLQSTPVNQWQWLRFGPFVADEVGDGFAFEIMRERGTAGFAAIDCLVISTDDALTSEQLDTAPALFGQRPVAHVAPVAAPPAIDGNADDPCWDHAVELTHFTGVASTILAQGQTFVRLTYDQENLYAFFTCDEPILNVAMQRRHEFRANVTERDGDLYDDDSVLILIPSPTSDEVYDFTINALGTIADAVSQRDDMWGTLDKSWQSGARAAGTIGEDMWTAEIAIPWADIGGVPAMGETREVIIGRISKARRESSSWNLSGMGFHVPREMGVLVFGGPSAGLTLNAPSGLQMSGNELSAAVRPLPDVASGVLLFAHFGLQDAMRSFYRFAALGNDPLEVTLPFEVPAETDVQTAYGALNAADLSPLYMTPVKPQSVKSSEAILQLSSEGPYEFYLNDELIRRGAAAAVESFTVPLQKGINVFAVVAESGTAAMTLEVQDRQFGGESWKMAPADTAGASAMATDDGGWNQAAKVGDHPELGAVVGVAGTPTVLRHTVLWEDTRIWPTPDPAWYCAQGIANHFVVVVDGLRGRSLQNWTTYLAVPLDYEIVGTSGFYGTSREAQPQYICTQLGEQQVNGTTMRVARVVADKPLLHGLHPIMHEFHAFVRYIGPADPQETETEFVFWSEANDGTLTEPVQSFRVRLLPEVRGAQSETLFWQLWGGWLSTMDDLQMREYILEASQKAGFTNITSGDRWTSENAPRYGLTNTLNITFDSWNLNLRPYLEANPDLRLVTNEGEFHPTLMCTTMLIGEGWQAVEEIYGEKLDATEPHVVDYDFEFGPAAGPHSCYCPRCLTAFRHYAELAADVELDGAIIRESYWPQWIDFMARRVAQIFLNFKESTHKLRPNVHFSTYSGYQTPENPERYGVDWRYVGDLQACDHAGAGYGRPVEAIAKTIEALQGIPLVGGALLTPYETRVTTPQTPLTTAWLLRVLLDSYGGVLVYYRSTMDGRSWYAVGEATRLAAAHEQVFFEGSRSAIEGLDPTQVQVVSHGNTTIVCVMNQTTAAITRTIPLPADAGAGREFYTERAVQAAETVEVTLEPGEAAAFVLQR